MALLSLATGWWRWRAALAILALAILGPAPGARAAGRQVSMLEDDAGMFDAPAATFAQLRVLGVQEVRVPVRWSMIAPAAGSYRRPAGFNASDPGARGYRWVTFDLIDRLASQYGIALHFDVIGGAPLWATGRGAPGHSNWEPNAGEYGLFYKAVATRYSGRYDGRRRRLVTGDPNDLPRVSSWSVWNEPDYGPSLAPQGLPGQLTVDYAPRMYRALLATAWRALQETGHGKDTILFGELAPRGMDYWGVYSGMRPLVFLRSLYCLDATYRPLQGAAAVIRGCPATTAASRRFRAQNPALFKASGVAMHPYMRWYAPNDEISPDPVTHQSTRDYASLGDMGVLERALDRMQRAYASSRRLAVYDTEFGYITTPPKHDREPRACGKAYPWITQATAAYYLNWAEYIHWRDPRLMSFMQYLLQDSVLPQCANDWGGFASGLLSFRGHPKPAFYAWRLPLYMPITRARPGSRLEVWGCVRPAHLALAESVGPETADIQAAPGPNPPSHAFQTVQTVRLTTPGDCYFDTRVRFRGSGVQTVRLVWRYPVSDPMGYFSPVVTPGRAAYSRHITITLR